LGGSRGVLPLQLLQSRPVRLPAAMVGERGEQPTLPLRPLHRARGSPAIAVATTPGRSDDVVVGVDLAVAAEAADFAAGSLRAQHVVATPRVLAVVASGQLAIRFRLTQPPPRRRLA